jgi:uncharacterized protein (DUF488 family)
MKLFTIGFTKTTAEGFFTRLSRANVRKLLDVRLNNVSQLAGFAKKDDLRFFAKSICHIDYEHLPALAPTQDILDEYKKSKGSWQAYAEKFLKPKDQLSRDFLGCSIFDFCNKIGTKRTSQADYGMSAVEGITDIDIP